MAAAFTVAPGPALVEDRRCTDQAPCNKVAPSFVGEGLVFCMAGMANGDDGRSKVGNGRWWDPRIGCVGKGKRERACGVEGGGRRELNYSGWWCEPVR